MVEFSNRQHGRPAPLSPSWSMSIALPSLSSAAFCCISAVAGTTATRSATSFYTSGKSASGPAQASESSLSCQMRFALDRCALVGIEMPEHCQSCRQKHSFIPNNFSFTGGFNQPMNEKYAQIKLDSTSPKNRGKTSTKTL